LGLGLGTRGRRWDRALLVENRDDEERVAGKHQGLSVTKQPASGPHLKCDIDVGKKKKKAMGQLRGRLTLGKRFKTEKPFAVVVFVGKVATEQGQARRIRGGRRMRRRPAPNRRATECAEGLWERTNRKFMDAWPEDDSGGDHNVRFTIDCVFRPGRSSDGGGTTAEAARFDRTPPPVMLLCSGRRRLR